MSVELHLPDLPEVPISLGPARLGAARPALAWHQRLREAVASYLPLLVMALLALGTWWLREEFTPAVVGGRSAGGVERDPDYTMRELRDRALRRRQAGSVCASKARGCGTSRTPTVSRSKARRSAPSRPMAASRRPWRGARWPTATAAKCSCSAAREVRSVDAARPSLVMRGEFLHAVPGRPSASRPTCRCVVQFGGTELHAGGLDLRQRGAHGSTCRVRCAPNFRPGRSHDRAARLHHRGLQRDRAGAGGALCRCRLAPGAGRPAHRSPARLGARPGPERRVRRCVRRRRGTAREHHRGGPGMHRPPGPAGRGHRQCRHQRRHGHRRAQGPRGDARDLRHQQPRPGRDLSPLPAPHAPAWQRNAGGHRQRRRRSAVCPGMAPTAQARPRSWPTARACAANAGAPASRW